MDLECEKNKNLGSDDKNLTLIGQMISSSARSRSCKQQYLNGKLFGPFSFINISEGKDEAEDVGHNSRRNMLEVAIVLNIVQRLHKEWQCNSQKLSVHVISPYVAQIKEIERRLVKSYKNLCNLELKVKSVEGLQDGEADIVIISTVKSNSLGPEGFVIDHQKDKVVITKARHCLWILGNGKTLSEADSVWKDIIFDAKECKCFFNAEEDGETAQVVIDVKSKLDELEDLLDKQSTILKATRWKVIFSEIFFKSFSKLPSTYSKKLVVMFLLKLANGWRSKRRKADVFCDSSMKIAKQMKVEDRYIIYTNDISSLQGYATQILKVWDILHLKDVPALVNRLDKIYSEFNDDFLMCCKERCLEGNLVVPRCYTSFQVARYKNTTSGRNTVENAKVNESLLLVKFYSLSTGVLSQLLSASDGTVLNVPFEVSDEEREIILDQRSTFILGRSGTGKTTVLLMKMFQKEQLLQMASEGLDTHFDLVCNSSSNLPRKNDTYLPQLFVTVNPKLCLAVKEHINNFRRFVLGDNFDAGRTSINWNDMDEHERFKDVPDSFKEISPNTYPLVITLNMFLLMLDKSIGSSYFDRFPDIRKIRSLETASSGMVAQAIRRKEVTYDKFRTSYWLHFNSELTKKLDPVRVFTEINSCIKGQLHFVKKDCAKLSLQSYLQLSKSQAAADERELIYQIFQAYEKKKLVRGEFDLSDLVNDLHWRLKYERYEGQLMDFVFIDEVQDLTMKQIALFKYISSNTKEGFMFAGDTAQTIAKGVDFRFQDIRCLFYKEFLHGVEAIGKERMDDKGVVSPISHLSQNFRTHAGVVNLAQSIIELICYFFPNSIDKLKPETSLLCGELPTLLDCGTHEDAIIDIFRDNGSLGEIGIGFGAEQVVMVRDDDARDKLANSIGRHALVLTILECKGLEFEDVLLYNLFGSSPLKEQWRVIYECMEKRHCLLSPERYPEFTIARHSVLCYELKQLYVAITRTRQRLWILEDSDGFSSPMAYYWKSLNLVEVKTLDNSFLRDMQVASSAEDWRFQGMKMLEVSNYKAAVQCFGHAKDSYWGKFARASELKASADNLRGLSLAKSCEMFREAAKMFESIRKIKKAAECYIDAEDYVKAGELYFAESDLQRAGECFVLAGSYKLAAEVYADGYYFRECLYACLKGDLFHLGLHYIRSWKQQKNLSKSIPARMDLDAYEQKFLHKCALASHKQQDKQAMMKYVRDFSSLESMRKFLKELDCIDELIDLEIENGNLFEAAKFARKMGDILREADILMEAGYFGHASQLYLAFVFASSLWAEGSRGWPLKEFPSKDTLLSKAKAYAHKHSLHFYETVCLNIRFLSSEEFDLRELEKQLELSVKDKNIRGEYLSARRILDRLLATNVSMYSWGIGVNRRKSVQRITVAYLIYHWNYWKEKIERILKCLDSLNEQGTGDSPDNYEEFCLEYFGVRKRSISQESDYSLFYPDAEWLKYVPKRSNGMKRISAHQLVNAARKYWCAEIQFVGMKLLELLESFRILSVKNSMPVHFSNNSLVHIFEVAQHLLTDCGFLRHANDIFSSLMSYINRSAEAYFSHVFSLNWENKRTLESGLAMRIKASRNVLKEATLQRFMNEVAGVERASPTFPGFIQVAVILLGSSWQTNAMYEEIITKCNIESPWNSLIKDLTNSKLKAPFGNIEHVWNLCDTLSEAFYSNCNMSPPCFVYLLNRLLLLVSCFNGCLYSTRSSVTEWLVHLNWNVDKETFVFNDAELSCLEPIYDFLANAVHELLIKTEETEEWVKKSGFASKQSYRSLVLKLLVLMCLICLNSGKYLQLLNEVLNRSDIVSLVPSSLMEVFCRSDGSTFLNVLAEALQKIKDPLVVIRNAQVCPVVHARRAIFLNVFNQSADNILENLFPSN